MDGGAVGGRFFSKLRASGGGQVEVGQGKGWLSEWTVRARLDPLPRFDFFNLVLIT